MNRKAARTGRTERRCHRIEKRHSARKKQYNFNKRHRKIDGVKNKRRITYLRNKLSDRRSGAFSFHQLHCRAAARKGNNGKQENKHAHSADPMRKAAPE